MPDKTSATIDGATGRVDPLPAKPPRYRCKLDTLADVKKEMARVYRETRSDQLDPGTGSKLVFMLQSIGRVIEGSDLEQRVEALEEKHVDIKNPAG